MQLREYLEILGRRIWILVVTILVITIATYAFTASQKDTYVGSLTAYVLIKPQENAQATNFYEYDNYYSLQSSTIYVNTIISWLKDPSYVSSIYTKANQNIPVKDLKKYSKLITAKKLDPSAIQISVSSTNEDYVRSLISATKEFMQEKNAKLVSTNMITNANIDVSDPIIIRQKPETTTNVLIAIIASLVLGLGLVYFTEYMYRTKK